MSREIINKNLKGEVLKKYDNKCAACGHTQVQVLRSHHITPVSLEGENKAENLVPLCGNCHILVHHYSKKSFIGKDYTKELKPSLSDQTISRIVDLVNRIHLDKHRASTHGPLRMYSIDEAIAIVSKKNKLDAERSGKFRLILDQILERIPVKIRDKCSYRVPADERFISINAMNYLIFKSPGYSQFEPTDDGQKRGKTSYDCFLTMPSGETFAGQYGKWKTNVVDKFAYFECLAYGVSYDDIMAFNDDLWNCFSRACFMAMNARKSQNRLTNLIVPWNAGPNVSELTKCSI